MKNTIWDKKIPTLLGILLITAATFLTSFLVRQNTNLVGKAAPTNVPSNVRVSNVNSSSFTVSYTTAAEVTGSINYGKDQTFGLVALDERDKNLKPRKIHSVKISNLSPSTEYLFSIVSGNETFLNNGLPYKVMTGPVISGDRPSGGFIVGRAVSTEGKPLSEGLVYVTVGNSQTFSGIIKIDGSYSLSLEGLRSQNLSTYYNFKDTKLRMLILGSEGESNVSAIYKDVTTIPTVVITKNYDLTEEAPVSTISATLENFPDFPKTTSKNITPKITSPSDSQDLSDTTPTFRGTGVPGSKIKLTIESEPIITEVTADQNGNWSYTINESLPPGDHKITITARDAFGVLRTITHSFTVLAQQASAATPTPTPSPTPTPTPSPTPTPTPTGSPSASLTPSPSPSPIVLPTPTPVISQLPEVGNLNIFQAGISMIKTVVGGLLFIVSRGNISF
jgi:hypothetical protein